MREEITGNDLDTVVGGTVYLSESKRMIVFSTLNKKCNYKCSFSEARKLLNKLYDANCDDMNENEYDSLVYSEFSRRHWI